MSLPHLDPPRARFPEANARINYEPCSNRRTEERSAAGANGVAEGEVVTLITVEAGTTPVSMSLRFSLFPHLAPAPPFLFLVRGFV